VHRSISPGASTWTYRHRIVLAATIRRGEHDDLRVYDTHLASDRDADERIVQARRVADLVAAEGAPRRVVAGDLNDEGEPEVVRELHRVALRDVDGGPTNPAIAPRQRLDHVVVPDGAVVLDRHEPEGGDHWAELSDHLPVLVAFRLA
jgi:endonuclease/exonuclease/phosphatase family metal-dependent hydrolase